MMVVFVHANDPTAMGMQMNSERLLERFLRYARVETTARDDAGRYPSSAGQLELGRLIQRELEDLGLADVSQDEHGIVMATVPATSKKKTPVVALNAHLDTSPETSGAGVKPQVLRNYRGGDIPLPGDPKQVIRVEDNPELKSLLGRTIITTDGTTLLGGDDKAGVAVIVETAAYLMEHREYAHGDVRICFTCDEEIGHGVDHVDLGRLGATVCYTLDGPGADKIDVETFSADLALITIRGINIHPSIAKGRMINALRVAAAFIDCLPRDKQSPETTDGRLGFLHPYQIEGGVAEVKLRVLLRDFETPGLGQLAAILEDAADRCRLDFPQAEIEIRIVQQYRNMADGLIQEPRAVAFAEKALLRLGRHPERAIIRGGTDGSRFTELGLPTPNLSTGQHNPHSPLEWACLEEMTQAGELLVEILKIWSEEG